MARKIKKQPPPTFNDEQKEVIKHNQGSCLVVAVAGAGKTTAVVHRIVRMINEEVAKPTEILATTFTKKAATEMNDRLNKLGINTDDMQVSTFHSICYKILKQELSNMPELDTTGGKATGLLKFILGYQNLNWSIPINDVEAFISNCKNSLVKPKECDPGMHGIKMKQAYELFEKLKEQKGFMTFDDLLIKTWDLFSKDESILHRWQHVFKFVIVDEFQDTNKAQFEIMKMLAYPENNIMVVGDDDQSIYSWRGAVPEYMINFEQTFNASVIRMEKNYRCPRIVGRLSNPLISENKKRLEKTLDTQKDDEGELTILEGMDFDDEAAIVLDYIKTLDDYIKKNYGQISILYRTNAQSRALEDLFIQENIPYELVGGMNFYDRKEIKDILSYFYAALNIDDRADEFFNRIINIPFRYLGRTFMAELNSYREKMKLSFEDALRDMPATNAQEKQVNKLIEVIDGIRKRKGQNPSNLMAWLVEEIGYDDYIKRYEGEGDAESNRLSNVKELIRSSGKHKDIKAFIQYIEKLKSKKNKSKKRGNKIILSTIHRSKGLEWKNVIVIGCNELILPHGKNIVDDGLEEERRLAYVAITRAKERLVLSRVKVASVLGGVRDLEPSRFLDEMLIKIE